MRRLGVTVLASSLSLVCLGAGDWGYRDDSGMSVDAAHTRTSGRPDVVIAVLGSGIHWDESPLASRAALSLGELKGDARPRDEKGAECGGLGPLAGYDCNADGTFTVDDYAKDPRLAPLVPDECYASHDPNRPTSTRMAGDLNRNCVLDPGDLVLLFSDGVDDDANGYTDDICGWDFFANDNDPYDDGRAGSGTAQASAIADGCPRCRFVPIRVADDFVGEANDLAQGLIYAADAKTLVASAALFTVDQTAFSKAAIDYAYSKNVLVVTGIGDQNARSHTMPATANHVLTVAGVRYDGDDPAKATTFTQADGCSNSGAQLSLSASTTGCSRDAAARVAGIAGLVFSAAADAKVGLSAEEAIQLFRAQTDALGAGGFDPRFGYGRVNAARLVEAAALSRLPPEVDITAPQWFAPVFATPSQPAIQIAGRIAAPRATLYDVEIQVAPGTQPAESEFRDIVVKRTGISGAVVTGGGTTPLAQLDPAQVDTAQDPDRSITIRVRATGHYPGAADLVGEARRVISVANQKNGLDEDLLPGFPLALGASIEASPKLADIDGDGVRDIVIADSAGKLHVFVQKDGKPAEATGFPYLTRPLDGLNRDLASEVSIPSYAAAPGYGRDGVDPALAREALFATPAVGDLDGDGKAEIVFASWPGTIYAINSKGQDLPGWPQRLPLVPSCPLAPTRGPAERCADTRHRWARGTASAPVLADLDGDGRLEIVLTSFDGRLWALSAGGAIRPGFPVELADRRLLSTPAVVDLTGDGAPEIVAGASAMFAVDANGATLPGWPIAIEGRALAPLSAEASAVSADLDGDGRADLVLSGDTKSPRVLASGPATLSEDPNFAAFFGSPAIGDMDQDGVPDVVLSGGPPSLAAVFQGSSPTPRPESLHRVAIFSGRTGQPIGALPVEDFASLGDHAIADVSGDEYPEIITGTGGYLLHAADACGREAKGFPKNTNGWLAGTAAVGDIDGDLAQRLEVVAGTRDGYLFAWTTRGTANGKVPWESYRHDNANTGNASTRLAQGTRERAAKPLVCDAPAATATSFELEGCALGSPAGTTRGALGALFFGLGVALVRRLRRRA